MIYFVLKYWKGLALTILVGLLFSIAYNEVYTRGYNKASLVYELKIKEYNEKVTAKITKLETTSGQLLDQNAALMRQSSIEFNQLQTSLHGKQLYTINAGKCNLSKDFIDTWNAAIKKANTK